MAARECIGLIGIGLVGSALAECLLDHGYAVVGYDLDAAKTEALAAKGGEAVASPAAVAGRVRRVVLSLMTSATVQQVVEGQDGILSAARDPGVPASGRQGLRPRVAE